MKKNNEKSKSWVIWFCLIFAFVCVPLIINIVSTSVTNKNYVTSANLSKSNESILSSVDSSLDSLEDDLTDYVDSAVSSLSDEMTYYVDSSLSDMEDDLTDYVDGKVLYKHRIQVYYNSVANGYSGYFNFVGYSRDNTSLSFSSSDYSEVHDKIVAFVSLCPCFVGGEISYSDNTFSMITCCLNTGYFSLTAGYFIVSSFDVTGGSPVCSVAGLSFYDNDANPTVVNFTIVDIVE